MTDHFVHLQRGNRVATPSRNQPVVSTCVQDSDGRAWSVSVERDAWSDFFSSVVQILLPTWARDVDLLLYTT